MNVEHTELALAILGVIVPLVLGLHGWHMRKLSALNREISKLTRNKVEHEMLIDFMCEQKGIERRDLPTRHGNNVNGEKS